jgi:hypothetical protein
MLTLTKVKNQFNFTFDEVTLNLDGHGSPLHLDKGIMMPS